MYVHLRVKPELSFIHISYPLLAETDLVLISIIERLQGLK